MEFRRVLFRSQACRASRLAEVQLDEHAVRLVDEDLPQPCCPNMVFGEAQAEPGEPVARGCIVAAVQRDMMDRAAATRSHRGLLVIARKGEACGPHMDRGLAVDRKSTRMNSSP